MQHYNTPGSLKQPALLSKAFLAIFYPPKRLYSAYLNWDLLTWLQRDGLQTTDELLGWRQAARPEELASAREDGSLASMASLSARYAHHRLRKPPGLGMRLQG